MSALDSLRIERAPQRAGGGSKLPWAIIASTVIVVVIAAYWWSRPSATAVKTAIATAVTSGSGSSVATVLNGSGYVTARREATVSSKVTGKVMEVLVEEGMRVKEGQVLARLDDTNVSASLALSDAQLESTKRSLRETQVRLRDAEREMERQRGLKEGRISSQVDYDRAEVAALSLRAKLAQQQADITVGDRTVAGWKQQVEDTVIRAPFAGVVTSKNAQPGEMISPMSSGGFTRTGICTIVDMESLEIEIDVNESYINRVQSGQPAQATLDAYPEWKIPCKVIAIIPTADRQKSTVKVRVGFEKLDPKILPEMSVKVAFHAAVTDASKQPVNSNPGVLVPENAVAKDGTKDLVYVVKSGTAERRAVTVAARSSGQATLIAGVASGEKVIVGPPAGLVEGSRVTEAK